MDSDKPTQTCRRCVMDSSAEEITFDNDDFCSFCVEFIERNKWVLESNEALRDQKLKNFITEVKKAGQRKPYDCIVGVSGGVDSSWVLVNAVRHGLRPLAVHMDNGWNSELAQNNIANLIQKLDIDLYTHVINWDLYRELMQAFFDADVIDVELLYDNAMLCVNYKLAEKYKIKYILSGSNQATEGMNMPKNWNWIKFDKRNIKNIAKQFSEANIFAYPAIGTLDLIWHKLIGRRHWCSFLDYTDFNKQDAIDSLVKEFAYKPYPYKHYESVFTRFYQGYILPRKFGVDKRKLHFSTLIIMGQMSREEALESLDELPYASEKELEEDKRYFIKKMGWTEAQLVDYISRAEVSHSSYPSEKKMWEFFLKMYKLFFN